MFEVFTLIVAVSALLSYINHKFLKLPPTIGVLILSIVVSLLLGSLKLFNIEWFHSVCDVVTTIDFRSILFDFLLSFLLFAGVIHVNLNNLLEEKAPVILFATVGDTRPILAVAGDGGFCQYIAEITTLVKYQMPVKIIILNNGNFVKYLSSKGQESLMFDRRISVIPIFQNTLNPVEHGLNV